ncbi:MAG: protein kinase [Novosphingobium sp.]|nr:protein kinase [Novosphingobium sp.]
MSRVYSNKALPAGTVLREWRLDEVLGVGGFGIVYKAHGIYFDELVAIKEYFPSSISERKEDDTIVPVDSDAEEVHALGLKKFVEEAKLLWNLSTPSRHPNIVSVRSLFEIHGTAYMVMDFEDGTSLSKLLKDGTRYNQASLTALIQPIAEGLERAHRVGVLHRDIKPANILVSPEGRPVLIDFGSARFESGEATSTTVTFHTPPYAAIEQYVKTYDQGPWTDVYALGVVLYECVTGEKPAEVLERLHGNADKPLADGDWPGFSKGFLAAIDTAMTIRPDDRPRSISEWLPMLSMADDAVPAKAPTPQPAGDETVVSIMRSSPDEIKPVAPATPGFEMPSEIRTSVPDRPSQAEFKRAGEVTKGDAGPANPADEQPQPDATEPPAPGLPAEPVALAGEAASAPKEPPAPPATPAASQARPAPKPAKPTKPVAAKPAKSGSKAPVIALGAAALVAALAGGGWYLASGGLSGSGNDVDSETTFEPEFDAASTDMPTTEVASDASIATQVEALATDAKAGGVLPAATAIVATTANELKAIEQELTGQSGNASTAAALRTKADGTATSALVRFVDTLAQDSDGKSQRLAREIPWSASGRAAASAGTDKQRIASALARTRGSLLNAKKAVRSAANPAEAVAIARQAMAASKAYSATYFQAFRAGPGMKSERTELAQTNREAARPETPEVEAAPVRATPQPEAPTSGSQGVSAATRSEFNSVVASARSAAAEIKRLGATGRPGSDATDTEKTRYEIRRQNADTAKRYESYLNELSGSMRGTSTESEARQSVAKANQTLGYLTTMLRSSRTASQ